VTTDKNIGTGTLAPGQRPRRVAFLLAQVGGQAAARFAGRIGALGVAPADVGLLRLIAGDPGRSQRSLAGEVGVVPSRMVVLIDGLEAKGLVERRRDERNRRNHALHLTAAGGEILAGVRALMPAHEDDICAGLSPEQRTQLGDLLEIIALRQGLTPGVHPGYRQK
jgi:DNA-binding MarR family transcriptional regulator